MKPGYSASVELFCSGGAPDCNAKLAVVTGEDIGVLAGTEDTSGHNRTMIWTSTPANGCPCSRSVAAGNFATSLDKNRRILGVVRQVNIHAKLAEWKRHTEGLMERAWSSGSPDRLLATHDRAVRALSFAEEVTDQLNAAEMSMDRFHDSIVEELEMETSDL